MEEKRIQALLIAQNALKQIESLLKPALSISTAPLAIKPALVPRISKVNQSVAALISVYVTAWQKRYDTKARPDLGGKTRGIFKRLSEDYPFQELTNLIQAYCQMDDAWFKTKGHDMVTFETNISKIALALSKGDPHGTDWAKIYRNAQEPLIEG